MISEKMAKRIKDKNLNTVRFKDIPVWDSGNFIINKFDDTDFGVAVFLGFMKYTTSDDYYYSPYYSFKHGNKINTCDNNKYRKATQKEIKNIVKQCNKKETS